MNPLQVCMFDDDKSAVAIYQHPYMLVYKLHELVHSSCPTTKYGNFQYRGTGCELEDFI